MRLSWQWLGDFLDLEGLDPRDAAERLTMTGTKIESVEVIDVSQIVIGRVLEQRKHEKARSDLWIHQVDVGRGEVRQIIAGAPNAVPGTLVPVALPGTVVPNGKEVRDAKIAGEAGQGMLCSAEELKLGEPERAILILDEGEPGEALSKYYPTEAIFEAEITPNRPDCLGHLGVARELAAATRRTFKADFMPPYMEGEPPPAAELVGIAIDVPDLCARFVGVPVTGVTVVPSPQWVKRRLRAAGVRPISNVVDATAYVMLEYGKPVHVFDLDKLAGRQLTVRYAGEGESILCLDGQTRGVRPPMLVVADAEGPVAIGGIIGGELSGVSETTSDVVIESAAWDGVNVRATSRALALRTEASSRHEKGLPPELALAGARRAAELVREWSGGRVHREWVDLYPRPQEPIRVSVDPAQVDAILGISVPPEEQDDILRRLGFMVRKEGEGAWDVLPPVWRLDAHITPDIAEEVGRIHGIEQIPATLPGRRHSRWTVRPPDDPLEQLREVLLGAGFDETLTPALVAGRLLQDLGLGADAVRISNPMSEEMDSLRTSLVPSLLQVVRLNQRQNLGPSRVFELARTYHADPARTDGLADEPLQLAAIATGGGHKGFLELQAVADRLAFEVAAPPPAYSRLAPPLFHPGRTATFKAGVVGEVHPAVLQRFDIDGRAVALVVDVDGLLGAAAERKAKPLPRFPAVQRDIAVVVAETVPAADLMATAREAGGDELESVTAFDEYRSPQLGEGVKSVALALTFRSPTRTLTDAEVDERIEAVRGQLARSQGARSR